MREMEKKRLDLRDLAEDVIKRPPPESCEDIAQLLQAGCCPLPLRPHGRMMEKWFGQQRRMCRP